MFVENYFKLYFHYGYDYNKFKSYYNNGMLHGCDVSDYLEGFDKLAYEVFSSRLKDYEWMTIEDDIYPESLRSIPDPPLLLFYKGDLELLKLPMSSIVGTRKPDAYGKKHAFALSRGLTEAGFCVVSGLARGVDGYSHWGALKAQGKTIAVIASGLDICYPEEHAFLMESIVKFGLLISEFLPWEKPMKHYFPWRNRIVSGLGINVVVIQCKIRSGTMTTVNWTLKQGKDVYVLPGDIDREMSEGSNYLVGLGAIPISNYANFLDSVMNYKLP